MNLNLLQDIHLNDQTLWNEFKYYWENKNYTRAIDIIKNNQQLQSKQVNASWFNELTNTIYQLETVPPWNKKQIVLSYLPPKLELGDIWFQIQIVNLLINVYMSIIPTNLTTWEVEYTDTLINAISFCNNEEIITNQLIDENNHTITFSVEETYTDPIVCMVYTTDNSDVVISKNNVSSGTSSFQMSYSGSLLSAMYLDSSGNKQMANINIQSSTVNYSLNSALTSTSVGRIVYIPTNYLSDILNVSNKTFSSTTETLICNGYMVGYFIKDSLGNSILGDIGDFSLNEAIINVPQNSNSSLNCVLYYT